MGTVFLSYSSEQGEAAARIELTLKGEGHSVFRDRSSLPPGESFDARIRAAVEESDLFVFLVSGASISEGRYTLTELKFAEQKWGHPAGHVLPVLVETVQKDAIPPFLGAVTMLDPRGNLPAEVAAEVARMSGPGVGSLVKQSESEADSGNYASAWKVLELAISVAPTSSAIFEAQERLAMRWLRGAGLSFSGGGEDPREDLVRRMLPVLERGAFGAKGQRLASLLAHEGWAEHLRAPAEVGGPYFAKHYRRALEVDPDNVYAHAMWGFEILGRRGSAEAVAEAKEHFSAALESGLEREYVRRMHVAALLQTHTNVWISDPHREDEALRVANEMRIHDETRSEGWARGSLQGSLWAIYHFGVAAAERQPPVLDALPPAEHLSLFRWLYPEDDPSAGEGAPSLFDFLFVLARLQERGGDRAGSLASYDRLLGEFAGKKYDASRHIEIADTARAAVRRLTT